MQPRRSTRPGIELDAEAMIDGEKGMNLPPGKTVRQFICKALVNLDRKAANKRLRCN